MSSKAKQQRYHARGRAMQRYGINLGPGLHAEWVRTIQEGRAKLLEKQSNRVAVFQLEHQGEMVRVVYDNKRKQIATVLPKEVV